MIPIVSVIQVSYRDEPVGVLQTDPSTGVCVFEYSRNWMSGGFALSPTELPLKGGLIYADPDKFGGAFAIFEDSLPDGYGLHLLERLLRKEGSSLKELTPLQRLSLIGKSGMGALSYTPVMPGFSANEEVTNLETLDNLQEKALGVLSEKNDTDIGYLYYNSANSGGARPKTAMKAKDGSHWLVKFRHTYDPLDIGKIEYLYMDTAKKGGIHIPKTRLIQNKYFAIQRFDFDEDGRR